MDVYGVLGRNKRVSERRNEAKECVGAVEKDENHVLWSFERKLGVPVFSSLFMWGGISPVKNDFKWKFEMKNHQKKGFLLPAVTYFAENLSGLKNFCSLSSIDRELLCFPLIFSFSTPFRSSIGNPSFSFLFYCSFLCFHIFLFSYFPFPFLSIRSPLRRFCCPSLQGKG